ncbi:DUF1189 domain-containing protein [Brochothrix campestris]|uniref:DUF1189 domain-containing protein n=1 Tax=Brochothrix campestris FSL F6-1037 TaxID=1265861 RepID=W7D8B7_9LIST|nr:DUF1189 domain-containing protein [Brochothrix campestris]EUJ41683.1 hypothetical protein BCAMP_02310 [Brochothrix campestris FSL F6-1037]
MKLFTRFIKSIYSPDDIASYRTVKTGGFIAQIILIACLAFIPTAYLVATQSTALLADVTDVVKNDFPDFTIKDGTLQATSDKTIMKSLNQGVLGFATSDDNAESSLSQLTPVTQIGVGFFKEGLVVEYFGTSQTIPYSMINLESKADLVKMLDSTKESATYVLTMIFIFMFVLLLVMTTIKVFFYGLFAFLLGKSGRKNITYLAAVKISAFSWSLMTVFTFITDIASISISYLSEFNILITIVIMFLAVKRIPMEK